MKDLLTVVLLHLAVYRATRFIVFDTIPVVARPTAWAQRQIQRRFGDDWAHGLDCAWCVSVWLGGLITLGASFFIDLPVPWLLWPATSVAAGFLGYLDQLAALRVERAKAGDDT